MNLDVADRVFDVAAELFALLAEPTRLRILCELGEGERSVGELRALLNVRQPTLSQHLRLLHRGGIVGRRRAGSRVYYRIVSHRARLLRAAVCAEAALLTARPPNGERKHQSPLVS